jgi:hypothetical protein
MTRSVFLLTLFLLPGLHLIAQTNTLRVQPGTHMVVDGTTQLVLENTRLEVDGTFTPGMGTVSLTGNGTTASSAIAGTGSPAFHVLRIDRGVDSARLETGISVAQSVSFVSGILDLNGNDLNLGATGLLNGETETTRITGASGKVIATQTLTAPSGANPGNLGLLISSPANLGATTVRRGHASQQIFNSESVDRYFEVNPANNSGLGATATFRYFDAELNGLNESGLQAWQQQGGIWDIYAVLDSSTSANYVETATDNFGLLTLGAGIPQSCYTDGYEPNDIPSAAANLYGGALSGPGKMKICPRFDEDWYSFNVPSPNKTIRVRLEKLPANFNVELYGSSGLIASGTQPGLADELILYPGAAAGTYYVKVYGAGGAWHPVETYELIVTTSNPAPPGGVAIKPNPILPVFKGDMGETELSVFPNPTAGTVQVKVSNTKGGEASWAVYDATGSRVLSGKWDFVRGENLGSIDLSRMTAGTYLVEVLAGNSRWTEKVVRARE